MPPESVSGYAFSNPLSPIASTSWATVSFLLSSGTPLILRPYAMLPATVSQGNDVYFWKTMPRSLPGPFTTSSLTSTSPQSAWSRPAVSRNSVDLPQPDGPSRTRNSPTSRPAGEYASSISKLIFSSAFTHFPSDAGNVRLTFRTVIFDFLCSMFRRLQVRSGSRHGSSGASQSAGCLAPREQLAL